MKQSSKNRLYKIVISNRTTNFVAKLFGMVSKFKNGDFVRLKYDRSKKFFVVSNVIIDGKIQLGFFNPDKGIIEENAYIEPSKLEYSPEEFLKRYKEFGGIDDLEVLI